MFFEIYNICLVIINHQDLSNSESFFGSALKVDFEVITLRILPKSARRGSGRKKSFIDSSSRTRFLLYEELLVCFGNFTGTNDSMVVMLDVFLLHALIGISMDCTTSLGWTHSLSRFQTSREASRGGRRVGLHPAQRNGALRAFSWIE